MAVIFMDGFDYYQGGCTNGALTGDMPLRWTDASGGSGSNGTIAAAYARQPGGQGLQWNVGGSNRSYPYKSFASNYVSGLLGFAFNSRQNPASQQIAVIRDGTTEQISLRTNASNVLTVTRNGTVLATGSTALIQSTWYYAELKFTIDNSAGSVEVHLNGVSEIAATGSLDTQNSASTQWNAFGLNFNTGANQIYWLDDIYVLDTSTGANTDFLGPVRCVPIFPSAPGNYAQWTANGGTNEGNVADLFEDGDASFNQSSTANQIDSFVMQDLPTASGSVYAVQHVLVARQDAGAARTIAPLTRIGGTDYVGTTQSLSSTYQFLTEIDDESPATSSAWTTSEVAGLEAGYKLIS